MGYCVYCDPKIFTIYGYCNNCNRRCECPSYDSRSKMSLSDYEAFRYAWNKDRPDIVMDAMRRKGDDKLGSD